MVEGFWKRLGREAARTQGAVLPAFKDFKTRFIRMNASCGAAARLLPVTIDDHQSLLDAD